MATPNKFGQYPRSNWLYVWFVLFALCWLVGFVSLFAIVPAAVELLLRLFGLSLVRRFWPGLSWPWLLTPLLTAPLGFLLGKASAHFVPDKRDGS